jgi:hypothetical protein
VHTCRSNAANYYSTAERHQAPHAKLFRRRRSAIRQVFTHGSSHSSYSYQSVETRHRLRQFNRAHFARHFPPNRPTTPQERSREGKLFPLHASRSSSNGCSGSCCGDGSAKFKLATAANSATASGSRNEGSP